MHPGSVPRYQSVDEIEARETVDGSILDQFLVDSAVLEPSENVIVDELSVQLSPRGFWDHRRP